MLLICCQLFSIIWNWIRSCTLVISWRKCSVGLGTYDSVVKLHFVWQTPLTDSASMGAALRAAHGWLCHKKGNFVPISRMYMDKLETSSLNCKLAVSAGDKELVSKYAVLMKKRVEIENRLVQKLGRMWNVIKHAVYDHFWCSFFQILENLCLQSLAISLSVNNVKKETLTWFANWQNVNFIQ